MARVQGVKEKLHAPLYDAFLVPGDTPFATAMGQDKRSVRFFMDVQGKTKLETNLQAAGVLPSLNNFEARALRLVASSRGVHQDGATVSEDEFLNGLIYNSVLSLIVGEKVMIEMPTFWFPAGAGVFSHNGSVSHGSPDPMATFRFAEPVSIEPQQNFRVELLFPQGVPEKTANLKGELRLWVILDGYLTRDVQ
jgi:hypothetical protein